MTNERSRDHKKKAGKLLRVELDVPNSRSKFQVRHERTAASETLRAQE
jgi:hypothetical protein